MGGQCLVLLSNVQKWCVELLQIPNQLFFFSAQNEIFSIGYGALRRNHMYNYAEKLKCQKDFLHV
jgi:hypothetical protein